MNTNGNPMLTAQTTILTDFSASSLIAALDANLRAFFTAIGALPAASEAHTQHYHRWSNAGILSPMFNGISSVNLESSAVDAFIDESKAYFKSNNVPLSFW